MLENTGLPRGQVSFEVSRYITWPGQATPYKIGIIKLLDLRQEAMDRLGDQFDLKDSHNVVLRNGSLPLEVLERTLDDYIQTKLQQQTTAARSVLRKPEVLMGQNVGKRPTVQRSRPAPAAHH